MLDLLWNQFRQFSDIIVLSGALSCLVGNGRRQKSYLKQYVKINLQSYEPGGWRGRPSALNRARRAKNLQSYQTVGASQAGRFLFQHNQCRTFAGLFFADLIHRR